MKKYILILLLLGCFSIQAQNVKKNKLILDFQYANSHFIHVNDLKYYDLQSFNSPALGIAYQRLISDSLLILPTWVSLGVYSSERTGIINLANEQVNVSTKYIDVPLKLVVTGSGKSDFNLLMDVGLNLGIPVGQSLNSNLLNSNATIISSKSAYSLGYIADFGLTYKLKSNEAFIALRSITDFKANYYKYQVFGIAFGIQVPI